MSAHRWLLAARALRQTAFRFLLDREPKEAILSRFDITGNVQPRQHNSLDIPPRSSRHSGVLP